MAEIRVLQDCEIVIQARAQPHDIRCVLEVPGWPSLVMQRGNAPAEEIYADHLNREPDSLQAVDPGDCNCELPILRVGVAPILATGYLLLPGDAENQEASLGAARVYGRRSQEA